MDPAGLCHFSSICPRAQGTSPRTVLASEFFLGYRQVDLAPHEILSKVTIPFTAQHEYVAAFKQVGGIM